MSLQGDPDVRELLDQLAIGRACNQYAEGLDNKRWEVLGRCFAPDGELTTEVPAATVSGRRAIEAHMAAATMELDGLQHLVSNLQYAVDGAIAEGSCSFVGYHWRGDPSRHENMLVLGGIYRDSLIRDGPDWFIASRRIQVLWQHGGLVFA
jgi:hypothetical protein